MLKLSEGYTEDERQARAMFAAHEEDEQMDPIDEDLKEFAEQVRREALPYEFAERSDLQKQADQWDEKIRAKKMSEATGRVIFKYQMPVLEKFTMKLPVGAEIIRMKDEGGMFWLWAIVRTDVPDEERTFWAFKCEDKIPDDLNIRYVGFCAVFVQQELGLYIFEEMK